MGLFNDITGGRNYLVRQDEYEVVQPPARQKDYDYSEEQARSQLWNQGEFTMTPYEAQWTDHKSYERKVERLLKLCPISKACIMKRADALADIQLKVDGRKFTKDMLAAPNFRDRTMGAAMRSWEIALSVGGNLYLFIDLQVPGRPQIQSLRPDLVANNVQASRWEYKPAGLSGGGKPALMFDYDASGKTTQAWRLNGGAYQAISGALLHVSYYDPTSSTLGMGAGDAALRSVDIYLMSEDLIQRKFRSGGTMAGFITMPNLRNPAEAAQLKAQLQALSPEGGQNLLANGMDFQAAQLTFAQLQLVELRDKAAMDICTAFQVDSAQVNVGASTHANKRADDKIFYRNFIGPEAKWLVGQLEWGVRQYIDPSASITVDETRIQHIADDLDDKMVKWSSSGVATIDECRALVGLPPLPDGGGKALAAPKAPTDKETGLGQPEEKPGGPTDFNANAGDRGDQNDQ